MCPERDGWDTLESVSLQFRYEVGRWQNIARQLLREANIPSILHREEETGE